MNTDAEKADRKLNLSIDFTDQYTDAISELIELAIKGKIYDSNDLGSVDKSIRHVLQLAYSAQLIKELCSEH